MTEDRRLNFESEVGYLMPNLFPPPTDVHPARETVRAAWEKAFGR